MVVGQDKSPADIAAHLAIFNILWAVAHIAHILRKEFVFHPVVWIALLSCVLLIDRPLSRFRLGLLALSQITLFVIRLPATDNHMYIMFFVNTGILISVIYAFIQNESWNSENVRSLRSYVVLVLILCYSAAAIAKLNVEFFDSNYSCAVNMLYDATAFFGLYRGELPPLIDGFMPYMVAGAELMIPLLLLFRAGRLAGVILVVVFHVAISISPTATALDFTIMLFALVYLLLPAEASEYLKEGYRGVRERLPLAVRSVTASMPVLLLFFILVVLVWRLGIVAGNRAWMLLAPVSLILGFMLVFLALKFRAHRSMNAIELSRVKSLQLAVLVLLLLNVASPYLGIKTAGTFTMYSNLNTFDGKSNHFFLPRLPARTLHDDLVLVVDSSNEELDEIRQRGLRMTWHELRRRLARDPDASISFVRNGESFQYERADQNPELIRLDPVLHKLVWHRPDDSRNPRCLW